jgi:hypothetical protein
MLELLPGRVKLGQPLPESNLSSELNSAAPQQVHRQVPGSLQWLYFPVNGRSVPLWRVT